MHLLYRLLWYGHKSNHLTHWSKVLLEKLIVAHIVERFQELYGFRMFCTMFVTEPTLSLSSQLHILVLSCRRVTTSLLLHLCLPRGRFTSEKNSSHFSDTNQHVMPWGMLDTSQQDRQCTCNVTWKRVRISTYDSHRETTGGCLLIGKIPFVFSAFELCTFHTVTNTLLLLQLLSLSHFGTGACVAPT